MACPITIRIFAWISAQAEEESRASARKDITSWWRTLKGKGRLNEKFLGGIAKQKELLEAEGHKIIGIGKKFLVRNYQNHEFDLKR